MAEERTSNPHMRGHCAAEIAGQQYRAKNGGARNDIKDGASEQNNPKTENDTFGISELKCSFHDRRGFHQFGNSIHQQKQRGQATHDTCGPESSLCEGRGLTMRIARVDCRRRFHDVLLNRPSASHFALVRAKVASLLLTAWATLPPPRSFGEPFLQFVDEGCD